MYLNKWTPDFSFENDIPSVVLVWICLPHLPLHCWSDDAVCCIGNRVEPKENIFSCARICVEVDVEKGILKAVLISLDNWQHVQELNHEQLPFKCKICHKFEHLAKNCKKMDSNPSSGSSQVD